MLLKEALASVSAVVLASGSPRRKELLGLVLPEAYGFEVQTSDFAEDLPKDTDAADYALRTATAKGESVVQARNAPDELIISADTVVVRKDKILEKPRDDDHARDMLSKLSGKTHKVITGVALFHKGRSCGFHACTKVTFSKLPAAAIDDYVATGDPLDKAGGYGIQGRAGCFVEGIDGCYHNVVGLPVNRLARELQQFLADQW